MTSGESDANVDSEADDIASTLIGFLVTAFKQREEREPTNEEIQELMQELTEKRIKEMLGGALATSSAATESEADGVPPESTCSGDAEGDFTKTEAKQVRQEEVEVEETALEAQKDMKKAASNDSSEKLTSGNFESFKP